MTDLSEYDDFLREAEKDSRLGKQTMMVTDNVLEAWADGSPRRKIKGVLVGPGTKVDITLSELPSKAVIDAEGASWTTAKKRGVAQSINFHKALAKLGKTPDSIVAGDELGVEVVKNKEGYLRIAAILGAPAGSNRGPDVPF